VQFLARRSACSGARECLCPAALVLCHSSSTPKPSRSGLESWSGMAGEVEAFWVPVGLCWAHLHCWPGSSPGHIPSPLPWEKREKHPLYCFGCFQRQQQRLLHVKQNHVPTGAEGEDEHPWVAAGTRSQHPPASLWEGCWAEGPVGHPAGAGIPREWDLRALSPRTSCSAESA